MNPLQAKDELEIRAPVTEVFKIITDIEMLPRINPNVRKATGEMGVQGGKRVCEVSMNGKTGTISERLVELERDKMTVWSHETDTFGMGKMMKEATYRFTLTEIDPTRTLVTSETRYRPNGPLAAMLNVLMMRSMFSKVQRRILGNLKSVMETHNGLR